MASWAPNRKTSARRREPGSGASLLLTLLDRVQGARGRGQDLLDDAQMESEAAEQRRRQ